MKYVHLLDYIKLRKDVKRRGQQRIRLSGACVISSVLSRRGKNLKWWKVLQLCYSSGLFGKQRKTHPQDMRVNWPKSSSTLAPLLYAFSLPPEPAVCKLGQPGELFVSPEVLTPVGGFSFVPFSVSFSFLCLLAIDILDSFFPILTNKVIGWHHQLSGHEFEQTPGEDWSAAVQGVAASRMWCFVDWTTTTRGAWLWWLEFRILSLLYCWLASDLGSHSPFCSI